MYNKQYLIIKKKIQWFFMRYKIDSAIEIFKIIFTTSAIKLGWYVQDR